MPTASKKSMQTTGTVAAKAAAKAAAVKDPKGTALTKALPAGITMAKVRGLIGHWESLDPVVKALDTAQSVEDYRRAMVKAQAETRDPAAIDALQAQVKDLGGILGKASEAHMSLRVTMVRTHLRFFPEASNADLAVSVFGAAKGDRTAEQMARRTRFAGEVLQAVNEFNAHADKGDRVAKPSAKAALAAVNKADKATGESPKDVVTRARRGEALVPDTSEPRETTPATVMRAVTGALAKVEALKPGATFTPDQQRVLRETAARLIAWAEADHTVVTATATESATA